MQVRPLAGSGIYPGSPFEDKAREHACDTIDEDFNFYKKFNDDKDFRKDLIHLLFNDFQEYVAGER